MKNLICLSLLLLIAMLPYSLFAQIINKKHESGTIYLHTTFWNQGYIKDEKFYKLKNLKNEFAVNSPSQNEFELYKKTKKRTIIWAISGLVISNGLMIASTMTLPSNEKLSGALGIGGAIGVGATIIPITLFSAESYNHLQKAIWLHNEEILFKK